MPMKKLPLKSIGDSKPIRKSALERRLQEQRNRKNRQKRKAYNKNYYRKNRVEILKRAKKSRERKARGDLRITRRRSMK